MGDLDLLFASYGSLLWLILAAGFLILLLLHWRLQAQVGRMRHHYQRLTRPGGGNLEEVLDRHLDQVEQTAARVEELDELCAQIESKLERAVQRVGLVRFNPFSDTGGDQSFSIAMLDACGDGL